MKEIFNNIINVAQQQIYDASNDEIYSELFETKLVNSFKVNPPEINLNNIEFEIGEETIGFVNAPDGVAFSPGEKMEYAMFTLLIEGDKGIFNRITENFTWTNSFYVGGHNLYYKEIPGVKLTGNKDLIMQIRDRALLQVKAIRNTLTSFKKSAELFNNEQLVEIIARAIEREKAIRSTSHKLTPA